MSLVRTIVWVPLLLLAIATLGISREAHAGWSSEFRKGGFPHRSSELRHEHGRAQFSPERRRVWVPGHWIEWRCHKVWVAGRFEYESNLHPHPY